MRLDIVALDPSYPRLAALYELVRDVYAGADAMSEAFDERFPSPAALAAEIDGVAGRRGALFLVAEDAGQPCGYVVVKPRQPSRLRHTADLQMGVLGAVRGRGIGRQLLATALDGVERAGIVEIVYLMVRADNRAALALYERMGFDRVVTLPDDTKIGERYYDGVLMRRVVRRGADETRG